MIEYREPEHINAGSISSMIRDMAVGHYMAFQYSFDLRDYHWTSYDDHVKSVTKYFKKIRVLCDEEAERDIATSDHDGGAWYLEIQSGTIKGY